MHSNRASIQITLYEKKRLTYFHHTWTLEQIIPKWSHTDPFHKSWTSNQLALTYFQFQICFSPTIGLPNITTCMHRKKCNISPCPTGRLWLYAGLIGSNNICWLKADLVVCVNPSSSSSWMWVVECFFWYWLTRAVLDKGPLIGCVCVSMCPEKLVHWANTAINIVYGQFDGRTSESEVSQLCQWSFQQR